MDDDPPTEVTFYIIRDRGYSGLDCGCPEYGTHSVWTDEEQAQRILDHLNKGLVTHPYWLERWSVNPTFVMDSFGGWIRGDTLESIEYSDMYPKDGADG